MPINYNILQPQPVGGVVGSIAPRPSSLDSLASGVMQGAAQGAAVGQSLQQTKQAQAEAPLRQQILQQGAESGAIDLQLKKEGIEAAKQQALAFKQSFDKGLAIMQQQDPAGYVKIQQGMAETKNTLAQAAEHLSNNKSKTMEVYNNMAATGASLASDAAQGKTPEEQQALWSQGLKFLDPSVASLYPQQYDRTVNMRMLGLGADAQLAMIKQKESGSLDPLAKNQNALDSLLQQKGIAMHNGRDTAAIDKKIQETQDRINSLSQGQSQNRFSHENTLRDEVNKQTIPFQQVNDAYGRVLAAVKPDEKTGQVTGAGDLALIFNYMKMLDPGSTVREGEFATAQNSAGLPEILRAKYNKVMTGERLSPQTRDEFVTKAKDLYKVQEQGYQKTVDNYTDIAKRNGLDPANVIQDVRVKGRGDAPKSYTLNGAPFDMNAAMKDHPGMSAEDIAKAAGLK